MGNILSLKLDIGELDLSMEDIEADLNTPYGEHVARQQAYEKAYSESIKDILRVTCDDELTPIGGGAVQISLANAQDLASRSKWNEALGVLKKTAADAIVVVKRKPYATARRKYEDTILAYKAITYAPPRQESYGKQLETIWKSALALANDEDFAGAKNKIDEAVVLIGRIDSDESLAAKQRETKLERDNNKVAMTGLLAKKPLDTAKLLELTKEELRLAKEAAKLGDDPGKSSREPCKNPLSAEALFKKYDWFKLKDKLHDLEDDEVDKETMWDLWRYRQKYVTDLIDSLRVKYPGIIAKASGSTDMESDIDITFAGQNGTEIDAAREFNQTIIDKFGKPAGRVFDVNIYPRDYNAIKESFNPDFNLQQLEDVSIDHPESEGMTKMSQIDMDVATLLKQRRFLDQSSFNKLLASVVAGVEGEANKKKVMKQFEEGEDIYFLTSSEKVEAIIAKLVPKPENEDNEIWDWIKRYNTLKSQIKVEPSKEERLEITKEIQNLIPAILERLEQEFEAEVMETTDELYLGKMKDLRNDQARIKVLAMTDAPHSKHHPEKTCEEEHSGKEHEAWRVEAVDALKARVKRQQFENIVFANEAYMSQGAIEHIVAGAQAKKQDPEEAEKILGRLTPQTITQSCNEQMADFFKDMQHSEHELEGAASAYEERRITGEAFVHASKYLSRLLDAAQLLVDKIEDITFTLIEEIEDVTTPQELKEKVEEVLLALRKSSEIPSGVKVEVAIMQVKELFGVETIKGFRKKISDFGTEFNIKVRSSEKYQEGQSVDIDAERQYFGGKEAG